MEEYQVGRASSSRPSESEHHGRAGHAELAAHLDAHAVAPLLLREGHHVLEVLEADNVAGTGLRHGVIQLPVFLPP